MDANEPVAVYSTNNANEAEFLKSLLEGEGIRSELDGENQGSFSGIFDIIRILVRAKDETRARELLAEHEFHMGTETGEASE